MLVLDDLHWAGAPELLLLKHLVRSAEPMRLLVIGTYRDTDLSRTHPLTAVLADLRTRGGVERVALHGLDDAAVEALVAAVARHELDDALVALAHADPARDRGESVLHRRGDPAPRRVGGALPGGRAVDVPRRDRGDSAFPRACAR